MIITRQTVKERASGQHAGRRFQWSLFLLCLAGIFEIFYLLLFIVSPLPGLHLSSTPLAEQWAWTLQPARMLASLLDMPITPSSGGEWLSPLLLAIALLGLMGTYACAIIVTHHQWKRESATPRLLLMLLGSVLLFGCTLLFQPRLLSDDVFTYMLSGRMLAVYGANPLSAVPRDFPGDPYLRWVLSGHDTQNIFGPLWLLVAALLAKISSIPATSLLLFKSFALLTHLINTLLVWSILGQIAPSRRFYGTLLYAWNPLAIIELAGSGHNEGFLLCLLLLALWLYVHSSQFTDRSHSSLSSQDDVGPGRPPGSAPSVPPLLYTVWLSIVARFPKNLHLQGHFPTAWLLKMAALIVFGLAISTNLIALLLAPLLLWFDVRAEQRASLLIWQLSWRALLLLIPPLLIILPFWQGATTFFAITSAADMEHFIHSPMGLLVGPQRAFFTFIADLLRLPAILSPAAAADAALRASAAFIFALIYFHCFEQVRHTQHAPHPSSAQVKATSSKAQDDADSTFPAIERLLASWGIVVFWYMVLASGWFWPWYLLWLLWIIVLQRLNTFTSAMLILSGTALFIYPFVGFSRSPLGPYQTALIFGIPLGYMIAGWSRRKQRERMLDTHDR